MDAIKHRMRHLHKGRPQERDSELGLLDCAEHEMGNIREMHLKGEFSTTEMMRYLLIPGVRVLKATDLNVVKKYDLTITTHSNVTHLKLLGTTF
jgi:hypothetical protein